PIDWCGSDARERYRLHRRVVMWFGGSRVADMQSFEEPQVNSWLPAESEDPVRPHVGFRR
ncbi:hypothetical protein ABZ726_08085, partial [Streptomyces hundungensis]|uniref:hypothetical protein n=1 Tax=Streptomyces hundungensis TaxID=1077946 RepID=UPI0033C4644F